MRTSVLAALCLILASPRDVSAAAGFDKTYTCLDPVLVLPAGCSYSEDALSATIICDFNVKPPSGCFEAIESGEGAKSEPLPAPAPAPSKSTIYVCWDPTVKMTPGCTETGAAAILKEITCEAGAQAPASCVETLLEPKATPEVVMPTEPTPPPTAQPVTPSDAVSRPAATVPETLPASPEPAATAPETGEGALAWLVGGGLAAILGLALLWAARRAAAGQAEAAGQPKIVKAPLAAPASQARAEAPAPFRGLNHTVSLDAAERAANRSFPLLTLSRGALLAAVFVNVLALSIGFLVLPVEFVVGLLVSTAATFIVFFWQLAVLQGLHRSWMTFWFLATGAITLASAVGAPILTVVLFEQHGFSLFPAFFLLLVLLLFSMTRGWLALARLEPEDRKLLRPQGGGIFTRSALLGYLGIPLTARFLTSHKAVTYTFAMLASLFAGLFFISVGSASTAGAQVRELWPQLALFTATLLLMPVLLTAANSCRAIARALSRQSIDELSEADRRAPLLFLRAFRDDQVTMSNPQLPLFGQLIALGAPAESLDSLLVEEGTPYGPVVALGNPQDPYPPYGAARGYFENKDWQQAVRDLLDAARAIVLCMDDTEAVEWEVRTIAEQGHLAKTLFLLPPKYAAPEVNAHVLTALVERVGVSEAEASPAPDGTVIGIVQSETGAWEYLTSASFSRQAYLLALRRFLRQRFGVKVTPAAREDKKAKPGALPANVARPLRAADALLRPPAAWLSAADVGGMMYLAVLLLDLLLGFVLQQLYAAYQILLWVPLGLILASGVIYALCRAAGGMRRWPAGLVALSSLVLMLVQARTPWWTFQPSELTAENYFEFAQSVMLYDIATAPLLAVAVNILASFGAPAARRPKALLGTAALNLMAALPMLAQEIRPDDIAGAAAIEWWVGTVAGPLAPAALVAGLTYGLGLRPFGRPDVQPRRPVTRVPGGKSAQPAT
jgi:hypothetical protein